MKQKEINKEAAERMFAAVKVWNYFTWNYSRVDEMIEFITESEKDSPTFKHFKDKFAYAYENFGPRAAMPMFWQQLGVGYQRKLMEWIVLYYCKDQYEVELETIGFDVYTSQQEYDYENEH